MMNVFSIQLLQERSISKYYDILGIPYESVLFVAALLTLGVAFLSFKASRRANELTTVPKLIVKYKQSQNGGSIFLQNLDDHKLAYDIEIMPLYLWQDLEASIYKIVFHQHGENYTMGDKKILLKEKVLRDGEVETSKRFADIVPHIKTRTRPLVILFSDAQGVRYFTLVHFENGKERILRPPTKLTIIWRIRLRWRAAKRLRKLERLAKKAHKRDYPEVAEEIEVEN